MQKEMLDFIEKNNLSCFKKSELGSRAEPFLKTRDAKSVYNKVLSVLSSYLYFQNSKLLWQCFPFTNLEGEILRRQNFWKNLEKKDNSFLKDFKCPKNWWKPQYGIIVVTESETDFLELKKLNVPVQFISNEEDIRELELYDIVQVLDCENLSQILERLPQSVFLDSVDQVYLERHLEQLSGWKENLEILAKSETNSEIKQICSELIPLLKFINKGSREILSRDKVESALEAINSEISEKIKQLSVSGSDLLGMLSKGKLPPEMEKIVLDSISNSGIPENLFNTSIPVSIDEQELERAIKEQKSSEHTSLAEEIKRNSESILKIPELLKKLESNLILFDFSTGASKIFSEHNCYPTSSESFSFTESENLFLDFPQSISFSLDSSSKCSMLTGANSGGKTTLLEHVIQLITFFQLGLPVKGKVSIPLFSEIYYFAKTKGSASKGAFETLLTDISKIKPGSKTLILADEIEAVTEPGVAGKIICSTAEYFIQQGCFLIIATHLGHEIQKNLPQFCRIDGIEAKGISESNELIVDHNPVLGRLANSTPELIIEKLAKSSEDSYLKFLYSKLK